MDLEALFEGLTVGDLFPYKRDILTFSSEVTVAKFLTKLDEYGILSAPILNSDLEIIGICDMLDIVLFIIDLFPKNLPLENLNENELRKVMSTGGKFENTTIREVLQLSNEIRGNHKRIFTVKCSTPLNKLMEMFYQGVHRVLVIEEKNSSSNNVISQTDLLRELAKCLPFLDEKEKAKTVDQLHLGSSKDLISTNCDAQTLSVLVRMAKPPILSALPIVDSEGHLVATFSASNIKGLREPNFISLLLPVLAYLTVQPESFDFRRNLARFRAIHPVTCSPETSFESLVERMVAHGVHRLWVVRDGRPVGVVSAGDVFRVFLPWTRDEIKTGV